MKKHLVKFLFVTFLLLSAGFSLFAQEKQTAVVTYVKGKVEVCRNENWEPLKVGDELIVDDIVSTGFQSEARIKYNGSVLSMGAVTRITLSELSKTKGRETVNVNLSTGAVRSKVTHTDDTRVSYKVRSPSAVASVRGTDFMIVDNGQVFCYEGAVVVYPAKMEKSATNKEEAQEESEESDESEESNDSTGESGNNSENSDSGDTSESNSDSEDKPGAYGPANANTEANDIDTTAPSGAVVVGQNQGTQITTSGRPEKPMDNAEKKAQQAKNVGQTASEKESVSAGGSVQTPPTTSEKTSEEVRKGSVSVTVTLE